MSQEKVDRYKEEKKGRKARLEKEKRRKKFWKAFGPILALVIVAGIGAGIYYIPLLTNQAVQNQEEMALEELLEMLNASVSGNDLSGNDLPITTEPIQ